MTLACVARNKINLGCRDTVPGGSQTETPKQNLHLPKRETGRTENPTQFSKEGEGITQMDTA